MTYLYIPLSIVLLFIVYLYNNLIGKKNKVKEAYSSIDVMLKKRSDLIPQLVNTVKGYLKHESETLISITKLREKVVDDKLSIDKRLNLESEMDRLFSKLNVSMEDYPDLKASHNFMLLQSSLNEVEEQLSAARRAYNAAVNAFNNALQMFPSNIMGRAMGYTNQDLYKIDPSDAIQPKVSF